MEIFLIILGVIAGSTVLTLLTSCIVNATLNPFRYFRNDWNDYCIQISLGFYTLLLGFLAVPIYSISKEKQLHCMEAEWDEASGCYNITVSGSELKGVNIIHKENGD